MLGYDVACEYFANIQLIFIPSLPISIFASQQSCLSQCIRVRLSLGQFQVDKVRFDGCNISDG